MNHQTANEKHDGTIFWGGIVGLVLLILQIILGALTSTQYAALSCPDFPFCFNQAPQFTWHLKEAFSIFSFQGQNFEGGLQPETVRQSIHMLHRIGALVVTVYLFLYAYFISRNKKYFSSVVVLLGLLILQIILGISNILFKLPLLTGVSHTIVASILILTLIKMIYRGAGHS